MVDEYKATLNFDNTPSLSIPLDSRNYLPIGVGHNATTSQKRKFDFSVHNGYSIKTKGLEEYSWLMNTKQH